MHLHRERSKAANLPKIVNNVCEPLLGDWNNGAVAYQQFGLHLQYMPAHIYETDKLANPRCSVGSQTCKLWLAQQKQKKVSDKRLSVCALALVGA